MNALQRVPSERNRREDVFFSINKGEKKVCLQGGDRIQGLAEEWKADIFHLNEAVINSLYQGFSAFVEFT